MRLKHEHALALAKELIGTHSIKVHSCYRIAPFEIDYDPAVERDFALIALTTQVFRQDHETIRNWLESLRLVATSYQGLHERISSTLEVLATPEAPEAPSERMTDLGIEAGLVLAGRYQIVEHIQGRVVKAFDLHLDLDVAIRVIRGDEQTLRRAERAAQFSAKERLVEISSPATDVFRLESMPDSVFIVMRLFTKGNLRESVQRTPVNTLPLFFSTCLTAHRLHAEGYLHLNLKPENILVDSSDRIKLTGFRPIDLAPLYAGQKVSATAVNPEEVVPPELRNEGILKASSDVFGLASTFRNLLGDLPDAMTGGNSKVSEELERAISTDQSARHQSAIELMKALERAINTDEIAARMQTSS